MKIYPAIDIIGRKAVRLAQGSFEEVTTFNESPLQVAEEFVKSGSRYIHIVDLDGARYGKSFILDIIEEIKERFNVKIETGGGVRSIEDIERRILAGADRVILGTVAVKKPELVEIAVKKYGEKIAVGIDARDGIVAISGWEEASGVTALDLCLKMKKIGIKTIIYTDISKDGMMSGPNIKATKELIEKTGLNIIASGGVSSKADVEKVKNINASGVIIGKALYNGAINLEEVIKEFE